jgi:hypothetical protein
LLKANFPNFAAEEEKRIASEKDVIKFCTRRGSSLAKKVHNMATQT